MGSTEEDLNSARSFLHAFFEKLDANILSTEAELSAKLLVRGEGAWLLVCKGGTGFARFFSNASKATLANEIDCVVEFDSLTTVIQLGTGELKPASAFLRRKVSYSGSIKKLSVLRGPFEKAASETVESWEGDELFASGLRSLLRLRNSKSSPSTATEPTWIQEVSF